MTSSSGAAPKIMVFRPTMEEFKDFSKYLEYMESQGAHKAGLAKIIPPEGWCPRKAGYENIDLIIPAPISQVVTGRQGLYQQYNVQQKAMHVMDFKKMAESSTYKTPPHFDYEDLERKYWKNITFNSPIYGADVSGSLYDKDVNEFNIQHLNTILDLVKEDYEIKIEGVNTAYLYFGMWKTTFAWHTEDMDLYSINYLHFGAPKSWYVVPPEHGRRLERMAAQFFHGSSSLCSAFLRHKMTIIAPHVLKNYSIPFSKITQEPGEFMITFPFAYHAGFNHGFNCAESTNFALPRWIEYGKRASHCTCRNDCVKICMEIFVRRFQEDRYELWKQGKDYGYHPEDPTKYYAAPPPKKYELSLSAKRQEEKKSKGKLKPIKQRRQPVTKLKKINKIEAESEDDALDQSPPVTKKKKARRNPPAKSCDLLVDEQVLEMTDECFAESLDVKAEDTEKPPELKPFWHPEDEKLKSETEEGKDDILLMDEETVITCNTYYQSEAEILDKFPQLKNAIDNHSLSVKILDGTNNEGKVEQESLIEAKQKDSLNTFHSHYNDILSQNWRVEQVNNGLKIKLVSPKYNQPNIIPSASDLTKLTVSECSVSVVQDDEPPEVKDGSLSLVQDGSIDSKCHSTSNELIGGESNKSHSESSAQNSHTEENNHTAYSFSSKPDIKESPDSEKESSSKVKRAANSKDNWAHHLTGLWQHENFDFEAECHYNQKLTSLQPHCAICVLFTPLLDKDSFLSGSNTVPSSSMVKMPAFCYGNSLNNEGIIDTNSLMSNDGTAPLLKCVVCNICVHAPCYGINTLPEEPWKCNRCCQESKNIQCCLCVLRGGALKPTNDGQWAHVVCAILIPDTYFENTSLKEPINISNITPNRLRLKCKYCMKAHAHKDRRGVCVQCQSGKCYLPFHVTCGYMAGVIFESNDWPEPINLICTKHSAARKKPLPRQFTNVSVGESVIAKHKNRRYYWANVKDKYVQEYYSILFEDNSHSTNTLPEDIVSRDVSVEGPPEINEKVKIKWTDGVIYNGIFKGSQSIDMFVVEFDDGTVQHQERRQIFAADEELPKEVQSKMSHSSEGKGLSASDISGKRIRHFNMKYLSV